MAIKLKKEIVNGLGPVFQKKGFSYDGARSKLNSRCIVFSKGDSEPTVEEMQKFINGDRTNVPKREEILIGISSLDPSISVTIRCFLKEPPISIELWELKEPNKQRWFSVADENKLN